jgi:hypothetical protein
LDESDLIAAEVHIKVCAFIGALYFVAQIVSEREINWFYTLGWFWIPATAWLLSIVFQLFVLYPLREKRKAARAEMNEKVSS